MKKFMSILLVAMLILSATAALASDAPHGSNFIDENKDGVCDLFAAGKSYGTGLGFVDADGDGVCDNCANVRQARGRGLRQRFVDENGDGVCDLLAAGKAFGRGRGFVDENGDGLCDNCLNNGARPMDGAGRKFARRNQSQKQQAASGQGQSSNQGRSQGRGQGRGQGRNRK